MAFRTPQYRLHKPTGQAVVTLDGRDFYLGKFGSLESRDEYDRLLAEWMANGRRMPKGPASGSADVTVSELMVGYLEFAEGYYRRADGQPTGQAANIRFAVRPLRKLYGHTPAAQFGPLALKAVRAAMIKAGLCRTTSQRRKAYEAAERKLDAMSV